MTKGDRTAAAEAAGEDDGKRKAGQGITSAAAKADAAGTGLASGKGYAAGTGKGFKPYVYVIFVAITFVVLIVCTAIGSVSIPLPDTLTSIWNAFVNWLSGTPTTDSSVAYIIPSVRLPRVLCAGLVGAALAISGAAMQGLLKNPLADGSTLGVSSGASLGAVLAIVSPNDYPADITCSNAIITLAITNAASVWSLDKLRIQADSELTVMCSGLWGQYYNLRDGNGRDINSISNAFLSIASAENFLMDSGNATFSHAASTWEAGDTMDFGETARGNVHFPGYPSNAEYFAAIYRGKILIPEAGQYCFATASDDFSMVFINGSLVVDANGSHDVWRKVGYANLAPGFHDIVILYCQHNGGLGLRFEMSATDAAALTTVPNHLLFANDADIPAYRLNVADLGVENAGRGALTLTGPGKLGMSNLWFDDGAVLDVTGGVQATGSALNATVSENVPKGKLTLVADLTKTSGLDLNGIARNIVSGPDNTRLVYRNGNLYVSRISGTVMILR